jgi:F0F1-type ATP synthase membrane subunit c/vacuolar-type H+-ATPase subunit K
MAFFVILLAAIETPSLFSFITAMLIFAQLNPNMSVNQSYKLFSAAITMGLGSVGPSLAQWLFAQKVWKAISYRFFNFPKISPSSLLTEALIESGALFSFMVSILLVMKRVNPAFDVIYVKYIFLAISLCISLGCFASAIGIGYVGSVAIKEMAIHHDSQELIFKNSAFAQVLIETCSLFAFLISLVLLSQVTVF